MINRVKKRFIYFFALLQIFLIIVTSFAISFILNENFVSGQQPPSTLINPGFTTGKTAYQIGMAGGSQGLIPAGSTITAVTPVSGGYNLAFTTSSGTTGMQFLSTEQYKALYPGSAPPASEGSWYSKLYTGKALGGGVTGSLLAGVAWAGTAYMAVKLIGGWIGLDKGTQRALEISVSGGGNQK